MQPQNYDHEILANWPRHGCGGKLVAKILIAVIWVNSVKLGGGSKNSTDCRY